MSYMGRVISVVKYFITRLVKYRVRQGLAMLAGADTRESRGNSLLISILYLNFFFSASSNVLMTLGHNQ